MTKLFSAAVMAACTFWTIAASLAAENALEIDLGQGVKLETVLIKSGTFSQGSPQNEAGRNDDEKPRIVTISKDFYLGKYPVTVAQFRRFADDTGYRTEAEQGASGGFGFDGKGLVQRKEFTWQNPGYPQSEDRPVTIVTYDDAQEFAKWLARKSRRTVRLPTEAQWEFACRGGTRSRYYSGDAEADLAAIGWYRANSGNSAQPVGKKRPNAFGLYDMSGNVCEWCLDWYGPYGDDATDPQETREDRTSPPRRVLRGGSWLKDARQCRSAARFRNTPASRNADNGFRVAAEIGFVAEQPETQSGSLPDRPPQPQEMRADFGTVLCLMVAAGIVIMVFRAIMKAVSSGGPSQPVFPPDRPQDPRWLATGMGAGGMAAGMAAGMTFPTEPAADGFWINTGGLALGSIVHYRYFVFGAPHLGTLVVEPGGRQFVYTGNMPERIEITQVIPPGVDPGFTPVVMPYPASNQPGFMSDPTPQTDQPDFVSDPTPQASDTPGPSFGGFPAAY